MGLVQIEKHTGRIERQPRGTTPIIELDLDADREILSAELRSHEYDTFANMERVTVDWSFTVWTSWRA